MHNMHERFVYVLIARLRCWLYPHIQFRLNFYSSVSFHCTGFKNKVYSNNYRPKDVKCLMANSRKELTSIESTGVPKAKKEVPIKGTQIVCNLFLQAIGVKFSFQIMNKVP
jgi:hypothetical protein